MNIKEELLALQDISYADFQAKLTPNIPRDLFIGVRVPKARKLAKRIVEEPEASKFLRDIPHKYYDENILHGLLVSEMKDYDACIEAVDEFLPYVDNWAVCDIMSPKIFKKNKTALLGKIKEWSASEKTYTCRFGIEMLMSYFLDDDFKPEYLEIPLSVNSEEYYVQMMIAWFFATALAKQWDMTIKYIEEQHLDTWTHNKAIQKARESKRITPKQKEYLKSLKA
ncbi:DNA alkylation repair protein [Negativicoccus succinicivorans]|uniref:DNA alkylation repair protein n=1 Tax=Negativicoccus succinicivorans TaxID=620903 RepID=UPI0029029E67|nr:DNA alkylation repair protein [Negativicoccus succinicivorans]MDU2417136.1 DNA alkylation repair protein [Negativicoccus succinicivorans]